MVSREAKRPATRKPGERAYTGELPPEFAAPGEQWLNTENGREFIAYPNGAGGLVWVQSDVSGHRGS